MEVIRIYKDLHVYQNAFKTAMDIFHITQTFPKEEKYSLVDQIRRSSRSVCANLAEGWRKRRYKAAFIAKLSDAESKSCETQAWIDFAYKCNYINKEIALSLDDSYDHIISQIVLVINEADKWIIR